SPRIPASPLGAGSVRHLHVDEEAPNTARHLRRKVLLPDENKSRCDRGPAHGATTTPLQACRKERAPRAIARCPISAARGWIFPRKRDSSKETFFLLAAGFAAAERHAGSSAGRAFDGTTAQSRPANRDGSGRPPAATAPRASKPADNPPNVITPTLRPRTR